MIHKNFRICFIAGTLGQGGAERQLYYYLKILKNMGAIIYVLCFTKGDFWEDPIQELGIPVYWVGKYKSRLSRLISIINHVKNYPVDFIQSQHFHTNLYAVITSRLLRVKEIGGLRSDVYREIDAVGKLGKLSLSLPRKIVVNSKNAINNAVLLGISKDRLFYLPNFVDDDIFYPKKQVKEKMMIISFIGTLWPPKRVDRVILLAKKCKDEELKIKFRIYGDGVLKEKLMSMAKELGVLDKSIEFMGRVTDTTFVYQSSDLFLLTSDHEGTPNVILEAMACALPVISSNVGDVPELIKDGVNGYLFEPSDLISAFHRIKELYINPILREKIGENNRDFILENRSIKNTHKYLENLYQER